MSSVFLFGMFEKFRAFADIGRAQGITTTASVAIVGALTSTTSVEWYHIVYFTLIACFAHMALNAYIALGDTNLDSHTYVPSRNPVLDGTLSKKTTIHFIYGGTLASLILTLILFYYCDYFSSTMATLCFIASYGWLIWYGWKGKKYLISYDFSFSASYSFFVLFGVFAVGGMPTIYTWFFIGAVIFTATAFAQWENGLKDVDADRSVGVKSFAVLTSVKNYERLHLTHPYFIYGCLLKTGFIFTCFMAFLVFNNIYYLLFIIIYGIPSQLFILYRFLTKSDPVDHRKTILLDVPFTGILGYTIIIGKTGIYPIIFLIFYLILGYLIGSAIQYKCEFKFSRFSKSKNKD